MTRRVRSKRNNHIYRDGAESKELKAFEKEYGKRNGDYIYGAVVGKLTREKAKKRRKKWQEESERTEINQIYKSQMI